jgi:hypothetical protein
MTSPLRMADLNTRNSNVPISSLSSGQPMTANTMTKRRPILNSAPFQAPTLASHEIDTDLSFFSLETTLSHLIDFLVSRLSNLYPPHLINALKKSIAQHLIPKLAPTWDPLNPSSGSGVRSLIALPGKFPTPLVKAAIETGIDPVKWTRAISETGEWEIWVDPGSVCFREGGWAFADEAFENKTFKREYRNDLVSPCSQSITIRVFAETLHTVWQAPLTIETADDFNPFTENRQTQRPSQQPAPHPGLMRKPTIPIRAPAVFRIPSSPMPLVEGIYNLSLRSVSSPVAQGSNAPSTTTNNPFDIGRMTSNNGGIAMMAGTPLVQRSLPNHALSTDPAPGTTSTSTLPPPPGWGRPLKGKRIAPQVVAMPIGDAAVGAGRRSASPVLPSTLSRDVLGPLVSVSQQQTPRSVSLGTPANASDLLALLNRKPEPRIDERIVFNKPGTQMDESPRTPPRISGGGVDIPDTPGSVMTVRQRSPSSVAATGAPTSVNSSSPGTDKTNSPATAAKVQGYDGGNVGVLGGGVKLGGGGVPKTPISGNAIHAGNRARSASGTSVLSAVSGKRTVSGSSSAISEEEVFQEKPIPHASPSPSPNQPHLVAGIVHPHQPKRRRGRPQNRPYFGNGSPKGGLPMQPGTGIAGQPGSGIPMGPYGHQAMGYPQPPPIMRPGYGVNMSGGVNNPPGGWNAPNIPTGPGPQGWGVNPAVLNAVPTPIGGGIPGQPGTGISPAMAHSGAAAHMNSHVANASGINVAAWNLGVASGIPGQQPGTKRS